MSIEQTLERIAVGIEKLIEMQERPTAVLSGVQQQVPAAPPVGMTAHPPAQGLVSTPPTAVAPAPVGGPPVGGPPVAAAPVAAAPVVGPDRNGLLDQIREAANAFHRAHPERAGEVWTAITQAGGNTNGGINSIPAGQEALALQKIQQLGA